MTIKTMYRYEREAGKVTVSFTKPTDKEYTEVYRLIADEGKLITENGVDCFDCIDVHSYENYYEIEKPEEVDENEKN